MLHRARLLSIPPELVSQEVRSLDIADPLVRIPNELAAYTLDGMAPGLPKVNAAFAHACCGQLMRTLIDIRRKRDPNARAWETGVPIFLSGGGAHLPFYSTVAKNASERCERSFRVAPLRIQRLPVPTDLQNDDITEDLFLRMAVAYGLSYDSLDIGETVPPHMIDDVPPPSQRPLPEYVSKDQV
jgi:hypothetical protein